MSRIQQRSSLSRALETLSGLATRIHCVEDKEFDAELVAFLVSHLNDDNARRRLLSFLDHNNGMWACLASICAEGYGVRKGTGSGEDKQRVQKKAEEDAVNKFAQEGKTEVKTTVFEWAVDHSYCTCLVDPVSSIINHLPPYPWGRPEEDSNEPCSETFAEILAKRRNKEQEKQRRQQPRGFKRQQSGSADEPQSRQLEASAEERGTSSQSLDLISDMLVQMPVCDDGGLDSDMVGFLLPHLANPESRQRLLHFFEEADPDWHYCLPSILNLGLSRSARDGGRRCRCSYHRNPQRLIKVKIIGGDEQRVLSFQVAYERPSSSHNW
ncbi:hypothetical protein NW759_001876 [Fusarium solani]|nr:hypothetical protein NW759_001876 [Fusarium solani]